MSEFLILLVIFLILFISIHLYKRHVLIDLTELLYGKHNADLYLEKINRLSTRVLFGKKFVLMSQVDAYQIKKDYEQVKKTFTEIKEMKLKPIELFMMIQKEIKLCCETGNVEDAKRLLVDMEDILEKEKVQLGSKLHQAYTDCKYDVSLRLEKSGKYAKELYQKAKDADDAATSVIYFVKAAQAYHFSNDNDHKLKSLNKAKNLVKNTKFEKDINEVIDGKKDIMSLFEGE